MDYDSSCSRNTCDDCTYETRGERLISEEVSQPVHRTRGPARNWAWAHSHESYDWMDSHSPFGARDLSH